MATHVGWGRSSRTRSHRPRKGRVGVARNRRGVVVGVADVAGRDPRREERRGSRNRPDSPRSPREPLAVGCCAAHTDASSPQQRCGDRIHHPLKSIACQAIGGSRCDNAVIITVAGVDPSSIRQSSMSGTVTRNECGPSHFEAISAYRVRAESPGAKYRAHVCSGRLSVMKVHVPSGA